MILDVDPNIAIVLSAATVVATGLLVKSGASDNLKRVVLVVLAALGTVAYYVSHQWPDQWGTLVSNVTVLWVVATAMYQIVNAAVKGAGAAGLNDLLGGDRFGIGSVPAGADPGPSVKEVARALEADIEAQSRG